MGHKRKRAAQDDWVDVSNETKTTGAGTDLGANECDMQVKLLHANILCQEV